MMDPKTTLKNFEKDCENEARCLIKGIIMRGGPSATGDLADATLNDQNELLIDFFHSQKHGI